MLISSITSGLWSQIQGSAQDAVQGTDRKLESIRRTTGQGKLKPDRTSQYIGVQVRTGRRLRGMPRQALADKLGLEVNQLALYEQGKFEPPTAMMSEIAAVLGKPLLWFSHQPTISN